jgi:hypothetical protein
MPKQYQVYRLSPDGFEQSLGYYWGIDDVMDVVESYCIKYPNYQILYRDVN